MVFWTVTEKQYNSSLRNVFSAENKRIVKLLLFPFSHSSLSPLSINISLWSLWSTTWLLFLLTSSPAPLWIHRSNWLLMFLPFQKRKKRTRTKKKSLEHFLSPTDLLFTPQKPREELHSKKRIDRWRKKIDPRRTKIKINNTRFYFYFT